MRFVTVRSIFLRLFIFIIMLAGLQGCMNVATTSAEAVYNRHSIEKNLKDQYLTYQAYRAIYFDNDMFKNANITVSTYNREVLLAGQAPHEWQKRKAHTLVSNIPDIKHLYNLIEVQSPSSSLTRISDAWITTKVKAKLLASNEVDASKVKVITENGRVFLMGIVLPEQADAAVDLAGNTEGVLSVVRVFSYMKISKHRS